MDQVTQRPNPIDLLGDHIAVDLGDGFKALFDLEDMDKISRYKWLPMHNGNRCPFGCRQHIYPSTEMWAGLKAHNLVMDFRPNNGMTIDHINKNSLDNRKANLRIASKNIQSINQTLQRNSTSGRAGVSVYDQKSKLYAANWYEDGKKVRQYFGVTKYGEDAYQKAVEARLSAERRIPVYAEALYNRKMIVKKLIEDTGETEWDLPMPELLAMLMDEGIDVEQFRC